MKKIILVILSVLLFIPSIIFADMGAPALDPYKATVTNKNGAVLYDKLSGDKYEPTGKILKYGDTVEITFDDEEYAEVNFSNYIKQSDISIIEKNYTMKDSDWGKAFNSVVLKEIDVRKGPANAYDKTGLTLKPGTIVSIREAVFEGGSIWAYVEYNGQKGFIETYGATVTLGGRIGTLVVMNDTTITDAATGEELGTLTVGTELYGKIYNLDAWHRAFYIETKDFKGIVSQYDLADKGKEISVEYTGKNDLNVYSSGSEESTVIGKIKSGTKFKTSIYSDNVMFGVYYYDDGTTKGWIIPGSDNAEFMKVTGKDETEYKEEDITGINLFGEEPVKEPVLKPADVPVSTFNQTLLLAIIGALLLFIVALVTIMLVNKKKNN